MEQKHIILREILRNYLTLQQYAADTGEYVIEFQGHLISFLDLQGKLSKLAKRKKEALFYNVILDMKQRDVADIMGITTVSVGQYVVQATMQLSKEFWAEELITTEKENALEIEGTSRDGDRPEPNLLVA